MTHDRGHEVQPLFMNKSYDFSYMPKASYEHHVQEEARTRSVATCEKPQCEGRFSAADNSLVERVVHWFLCTCLTFDTIS
jgi:hypothetical protein